MVERYNELTDKIIGSCIEVHKNMGPGLLEKIYEKCLIRELELRGVYAESQVEIPLVYKGVELDKSYVIDILVENEIVLELKAIDIVLPVFEAQLISYLKLSGKKVGLLINFNVPLMKHGVKRFVNGL